MEYTWWCYRLNHVLYEVRSPLVGYPVVKKGCIATLESYREFLEESAGFHTLIVTSVAAFSALSLPGDAMRQVTPLRGAGRLSPACCRAPRLCQAACRACPGTAAASFTMATCSGLTTVTSRAASLPWAQWGRNTSAGLPPSPGTKALPSLAPLLWCFPKSQNPYNVKPFLTDYLGNG